MKVRIWQEQSDLFEFSVLEQTVEVALASMQELCADEVAPVVLVGRALTSERLAEFRSLFQSIFRSGRTIVVVPPFGDLDIGRYLDTPVGVRLVRRRPDAIVRVVDVSLELNLGQDLSIRSDHVIETALGAGLIAVDGAGKPLALKYQPSNTSGATLLCSMQLLSYTALSNEEDRQTLLAALLAYRASKTSKAREDASNDAAPVDAGYIATILVALAAARSVDPNRLRTIAEKFLQLSMDNEATENVLGHLEAEGVLTRGNDGKRLIREEALESAIDDLGLHACVRELQEIIRNQPEVHT